MDSSAFLNKSMTRREIWILKEVFVVNVESTSTGTEVKTKNIIIDRKSPCPDTNWVPAEWRRSIVIHTQTSVLELPLVSILNL